DAAQPCVASVSHRSMPRAPAVGELLTSSPPPEWSRHHVHTRAGFARITPLWLSCSPAPHLSSLNDRIKVRGLAQGVGQIRASKWAKSEYRNHLRSAPNWQSC